LEQLNFVSEIKDFKEGGIAKLNRAVELLLPYCRNVAEFYQMTQEKRPENTAADATIGNPLFACPFRWYRLPHFGPSWRRNAQ
jgi:hypothetical protein